ncbi:MAG: hypothetical protein KF691_16160 [Phycisphaeraceae bacterium]|nr:hypothetical protein [Phycisphaeraceae bacterium]
MSIARDWGETTASAEWSGLPKELRDALARELDPDEKLLWAGCPVAWRVAIGGMTASVFLAIVALLFGIAFFGIALDLWHEFEKLRSAGLAPSPIDGPTKGRLLVAASLGVVITASGLFLLLSPLRILANAKKMIYALTNTRVLVVCVSRRGRVRVRSLEPGHPLELTRLEHRDGSGTIVIGARVPGNTSREFSLIGTREPREVERRIRQTFGPK